MKMKEEKKQEGCKVSPRRCYEAKKRQEAFKGCEEGLEKAVFQCDRLEYASLKTTLKELALFAKNEHAGGQDISFILHQMKDIKLIEPIKLPATAGQYVKAVWAEDYKEYREKKQT